MIHQLNHFRNPTKRSLINNALNPQYISTYPCRRCLSSASSSVSTAQSTAKQLRKPSSQEEHNVFHRLYDRMMKILQQRKKTIIGGSSFLITYSSLCFYTRQWREEHLDTVPLASQSDLFYVSDKSIGDENSENNEYGQPPEEHVNGSEHSPKRDLRVLSSMIARTGLMGRSKPGANSVKDELSAIRSWHQQRGYRGGLVLRELKQPLYTSTKKINGGQKDPPSLPSGDDVDITPDQLRQRECYYLYYEIKPNGHCEHAIFCRGTTLLADVWTCLNFIFVWDDELECYLHSGFRSHAQRLVDDVEPLLVKANNSTVEVCGHSLGGAVAMIVSMKLQKRGYNVTRCTSVAAPRFCPSSSVQQVMKLLPRDSLRIENDLDGIPFLPMWGEPVGDKLWFVSGKDGAHSAKFIPMSTMQREDSYKDADDTTEGVIEHMIKALQWVDSTWINSRIPETAKAIDQTHRIPSYVSRVEELIIEMNEK